MEQERVYGTIFLPTSPEKRITGVWLIIKSNSIYLETPANSLRDEFWDIILGEFNGIDQITFLNCHAGSGSSGAGGTHINIHVSIAVKNLHANNIDDLKFKKAVLRSPALLQWITTLGGINYEESRALYIPDKQTIVETMIDNVNLSIELDYSVSYGLFKAEINKVCYIIIEADSPLEISKFDKIIRHLKKLILFLTNKNPEFSSYTFRNDDTYYPILNTTNRLKEDRFTQGLPVTYGSVQRNFDDVIRKWYEQKNLIPVIDLVLEHHFNTEMSMQGFFISACMAIEIFQNNFGKTTEETRSLLTLENRKKINDLIKDEILKKWFMERTQHWNNPTFKDRLMQFESIIAILIKGIFDTTTETFVTKVVRTRNDIVHRGEHKDNFASLELFLATKIIEFTLKLSMLHLLEVDIKKPPHTLMQSAKDNISVLARLNKINEE